MSIEFHVTSNIFFLTVARLPVPREQIKDKPEVELRLVN